MKILFLAPEPFLEERGTPIAIYNLIEVLSRAGHKIDLVTYHPGRPVQLENLRIKRIPGFFFIKKVPIGPSYRKLFLDFFLLWKAFWLCLFNKYDAVHGVEEGAYLGAVLSRVFNLPLVYDMDSHIPDQLKYSGFRTLPFFKSFINWFDRFAVNRSRMIISVCSDLTRRVRAEYPEKKIFQIEDLPLFENQEPSSEEAANLKSALGLKNEPVVLYTGNFEKYQGVELLVPAAAAAAAGRPDIRLVLVGGEPEQIEKVRKMAVAASLERNFIFIGKRPMAEIPLFKSLASVLVSPRTKGTNVPMKIYSYLYSGRPIVATRILSHTQVLNDETAILVDPEAVALGAGIIRAINDAGHSRLISQNARRLAETRFSRKIYEEKVQAAFRFLEESINNPK